MVVLTLWASFDKSPQAHERMRALQLLHEIYDDDSVVFLGVHESTTEPGSIETSIGDWGLTFPIGRDQDPFVTFDRYSVNSVPQTILIDRDGNVRYYDVEGRLAELIKDLRRR